MTAGGRKRECPISFLNIKQLQKLDGATVEFLFAILRKQCNPSKKGYYSVVLDEIIPNRRFSNDLRRIDTPNAILSKYTLS